MGVQVQRRTKAIEDWFRAEARDLPWRRKRTRWRSFVSEIMLQQTQVSRVVEKFEPFMKLFPTPKALAEASEDTVNAAWAGLGYYRRARNLQAAAAQIVEHHGGRVPTKLDDLLELRGVGRYTAGAVASIACGKRAPIVDGNVHRVLSRLHADPFSLDDRDCALREEVRAVRPRSLPEMARAARPASGPVLELQVEAATIAHVREVVRVARVVPQEGVVHDAYRVSVCQPEDTATTFESVNFA